MQYQKPIPVVAGWSIPQDNSNGFVAVTDPASPDLTCHIAATPGQASIPIAAGKNVELQWTEWPESHKGPVMDYLANCNGPCETVDKANLQWFKIDESGLVSPDPQPGTWASDVMIQNNNSWTVAIPADISSGNYVLRHETIALHQAQSDGGAQSYPQCVNLQVSGGGSANPEGVAAASLYSTQDPGIKVNIYNKLTTYTIPGPALYSGAISISQTLPAAPTASGTAVPAAA